MEIKAEGLNELSLKCAKLVDTEVFKFLKNQGYKFEETRQGIKKIREQLEQDGKAVEINSVNQKMQADDKGLSYQFDLEIKFKEVKK